MSQDYKVPQNSFSIPIQTRFYDTDAIGHVNHAVFVTYLETIRIHWIHSLPEGHPMKKVPIIIANVNIDYLMPIFLGSTPIVSMWVSRIGTKSMTLSYYIHEEKDDKQIFYAKAETVLVYYDYEKNQSVPIPNEVRQSMQDMLVE